jgi:hypothetical protein
LHRRHVRALLDQMGVRLLDDSEYAEVAVRLGIIIESIEPLMTMLPAPDDVHVPADLPRPAERRR